MKIAFFVVALVCVHVCFAQDKQPQAQGQARLSAPAAPVGRRPTPKEACTACRQTLGSCQGYNFRTQTDQKDTKTWVECMQKSFKKWRAVTGLDYWPEAETLVTGNVGVAAGKPDRVQCFAHVARSASLPCVPCAVAHPDATRELTKDSNKCWEQINKAKQSEKEDNNQSEQEEEKTEEE